MEKTFIGKTMPSTQLAEGYDARVNQINIEGGWPNCGAKYFQDEMQKWFRIGDVLGHNGMNEAMDSWYAKIENVPKSPTQRTNSALCLSSYAWGIGWRGIHSIKYLCEKVNRLDIAASYENDARIWARDADGVFKIMMENKDRDTHRAFEKAILKPLLKKAREAYIMTLIRLHEYYPQLRELIPDIDDLGKHLQVYDLVP